MDKNILTPEEQLLNRMQLLEKKVDGLLVMTGIYNRIIERCVDTAMGDDLKAIREALRDMKGEAE